VHSSHTRPLVVSQWVDKLIFFEGQIPTIPSLSQGGGRCSDTINTYTDNYIHISTNVSQIYLQAKWPFQLNSNFSCSLEKDKVCFEDGLMVLSKFTTQNVSFDVILYAKHTSFLQCCSVCYIHCTLKPEPSSIVQKITYG